MATSSVPARSIVEVIPSARRLVGSLRDLGYDFVHAVADIVDNSIAASASRVAIDLRWDAADSWVRISDNGKGMAGGAITEAMRFGAEREYELDDLGKFGLGLKTASLSQCRRLTVASRIDSDSRRIEARRWDLDRVERTNRWEVEIIGVDERSEKLIEPIQEHTGTVVLWESLERVLKYKCVWGENAKNGFLKLADQLDQHLGMVFHRFLSGEARRRKKLAVTINGTIVEPWDPYARGERATEKLVEQEFELSAPNGVGTVRYSPFVLPPKDKFSSLRAFERMSGPEKWNRQQGFYIYRADRMIQSGGWSRMRTADEHTKLARAALDFFPDLDGAFEVNIAKFRVILPPELKEQLEEPLERLLRRAKTVYSGEKPETKATSPSVSASLSITSSTPVPNKICPVPAPTTRTVYGRLRAGLERAAVEVGEESALRKILRALKESDPEAANELGW